MVPAADVPEARPQSIETPAGRRAGSGSVLALAVLALTLPVAAFTCPFLHLEVNGVVLDEHLRPVSGARVIVFLDDEPFASAYPPTSSKDDFSLTDEQGQVKVNIWFATDLTSSKTGCGRRPSRASVIVLTDDLRPKRFTVPIHWTKDTEKRYQTTRLATLNVGALKLGE